MGVGLQLVVHVPLSAHADDERRDDEHKVTAGNHRVLLAYALHFWQSIIGMGAPRSPGRRRKRERYVTASGTRRHHESFGAER